MISSSCVENGNKTLSNRRLAWRSLQKRSKQLKLKILDQCKETLPEEDIIPGTAAIR